MNVVILMQIKASLEAASADDGIDDAVNLFSYAPVEKSFTFFERFLSVYTCREYSVASFRVTSKYVL